MSKFTVAALLIFPLSPVKFPRAISRTHPLRPLPEKSRFSPSAVSRPPSGHSKPVARKAVSAPPPGVRHILVSIAMSP